MGSWERLRRVAWPLAAGMFVAILLMSSNVDAAWIVFGAVAIMALVVSAAGGSPPPNPSNTPSRSEGTDWGLPVITRDVFERLPDPLMLLDASERVVFANRAMRAVIGVDAERKHVSSLLRTPTVLEAIRRSAARGEPASVEFTFPVPIPRTYQAYIAHIAGGPVVTILLLHDLTAMKRAEQMRADFVANASHELRTPLAALSGFIDTLKGHARDDMAAREQFLGIMTVEAERMRRLIDDLLSLTRIEQNEHVPPSGETSLESVLREAMATLMPLAKAEGISLELTAAAGLPPAAGERDELIQIFQNLVHNAIKYGKPGGHVWLGLALAAAPGGRGAEKMLAASIRDDGEGIPQNAVPRLTERFYRVDVKRSREKGGTGLGLAIVKHIVNRHQGRLTVESVPGEGSIFMVYLPAAQPADAVIEMS